MFSSLDLAISLVTAVSAAMILSVLAWLFKLRDQDSAEAREFFLGTFSGALKISLIYFLIIPYLPSLGFSHIISNSLISLFTAVNFVLAIELVAYLYTHFAHAHKEALALGILGGITRSEAITGSMIDLVRKAPEYIETAVCVVLASNVTMLIRNLVLLLLVPAIGFQLFSRAFPVLFAMIIVSIVTVYFTYKKQNDIDIKLSPISLRSAIEIVLAFSIVSLASSFFGQYGDFGYYGVAAVGAFAGALPVIFSMVALLGYKAISIEAASNIFLIACSVALINDALISYVLKEREFASKLFLNELLAVLAGVVVFLGISSPSLLASVPTPLFHLFVVLAGISIFSLATWVYFRRTGKDAKEIALGVFASLFNLSLIYFVLMPLVPKVLFGFVNSSLILNILLVIILLELFLFLAARLSDQSDPTLLGLVSGIVCAEGVTFSLARQAVDDPVPASKMIFAAKSSMFARNLLILAALSFAAASQAWVVMLPLCVIFLLFSLYTPSQDDSSLKLKHSSIPAVLFLLLFFLAALLLSKFALDSFGSSGLLASVVLLSLASGLAPMLALLSLFAMGQIPLDALVQLIFVSSAVVSINDSLISLVFRHPDLAKTLLKKQILPFLFSLALLYLFFFR